MTFFESLSGLQILHVNCFPTFFLLLQRLCKCSHATTRLQPKGLRDLRIFGAKTFHWIIYRFQDQNKLFFLNVCHLREL